ncbi:hypothetical protein CCP4SC76_3010043 [Gammaproteobacteria bacterium]
MTFKSTKPTGNTSTASKAKKAPPSKSPAKAASPKNTAPVTAEKPVSPPRIAPESPARETASASVFTHTPALIDTQRRFEMIREAAYYRAERRGFEPGFEDEDWRLSEEEVNHRLQANP